jgi:hypothetical protein
MDIKTRVCGIPCIVRVYDWEPYRPAKLSGPPEYCYEAEGGHGEWGLLTTRGQPAPWLEKKMSDLDRARIDEEVFEYMETA